MSRGIKAIQPTDPKNKNIKRVESIDGVPTFELEAEERVFFEAVIGEAKNMEETKAKVKWVWAWYEAGVLGSWGQWTGKEENKKPIPEKEINTNYAISLTPYMEFQDDAIGKLAWVEAFVYAPEGPKGKDSKGAFIKVKAVPKITDAELYFLAEKYTDQKLAYDQQISLQIGVYNAKEFGELIVQVWEKNKTKKLFEEKVNFFENIGDQLYGNSTHSSGPPAIQYMTKHIVLDKKWREEIGQAQGTLAEYIIHVEAVPVRYSKFYTGLKGREQAQQRGDIYDQGNQNAHRLDNQAENDAIKKDHADNKDKWNKTTSSFFVVWNTDDELYEQHNKDIDQIVKVQSAAVRTINFDPCGFKKITIQNPIFANGKKRSIEVFKDDGVSLVDKTIQAYEIIAGNKEMPKELTILIDNYTHGTHCRYASQPIKNHATAENVVPHAVMSSSYPFTDQAWFKEKKYFTLVQGDQIEFGANLYYPYHMIPLLNFLAKVPINYFLLWTIKPFKIAIPVSTCRYERYIFVDVYPDIKWTIKGSLNLDNSFAYSSDKAKDELKKHTNPKTTSEEREKLKEADKVIKSTMDGEDGEFETSFELSIKAEYNREGYPAKPIIGEFGKTKISQDIRKLIGLFTMMQKIVNDKAGGDKLDTFTVAERKLITFDIKPPKLSTAFSWYYEEDANTNKVGMTLDFESLSAKPLLEASVTLDLLEVGKKLHPLANAAITGIQTVGKIAKIEGKFDLEFKGAVAIAIGKFKYNFATGYLKVAATIECELRATLRLELATKGNIDLVITEVKWDYEFRGEAFGYFTFGAEIEAVNNGKPPYIKPILKFSGLKLVLQSRNKKSNTVSKHEYTITDEYDAVKAKLIKDKFYIGGE